MPPVCGTQAVQHNGCAPLPQHNPACLLPAAASKRHLCPSAAALSHS